MKALNDYIIVKNHMTEEKTTASSLIVERAEKNAENNGIVMSIGELVKTDIKVGDLVWFSSVAIQIGDSDRKLVAIKENSIVAVGDE
jgi:co-chaperonin GroES (HSP10)